MEYYCAFVLLPPSLLALFFLHKNNKNMLEEREKVDKDQQCMIDEIVIPMSSFLNNYGRVIHDKSAHYKQSDVEIGLEQETRAEKKIEQGHVKQNG